MQIIYLVLVWSVDHLSWVPSLLGGVSAVFAAYFWSIVGDPPQIDEGAQHLGVLFTGLTLAFAGFVEVWRRQARNAERTEASQIRLLLGDAASPIVDELAKMASMNKLQRGQSLVKVVSNVCAAIPLVLPDAKQPRVIVYAIENDPAGYRRLTALNFFGRPDRPAALTDVPRSRGASIFKVIADGETVFEPDIRRSTRPGVQSAGKKYLTFISSPIITGTTAFGMVSIDCPIVGSLDQNDKPVVEFFANLLATAFALSRR
ncbi:hypothetical protein B7R22_05490 [Subtercola boreus]|uniref:GAF domain-containing protein n=1 Tax=Subtercola boreus TaxID=120213 RepID=A0A3E0W1I3_9MICO|nr:hypothetical protein [Subtercola boreus]RFA15861.1 hypothetical protein B7R22_05490 [Subtercola boreus]